MKTKVRGQLNEQWITYDLQLASTPSKQFAFDDPERLQHSLLIRLFDFGFSLPRRQNDVSYNQTIMSSSEAWVKLQRKVHQLVVESDDLVFE
jgi:hypothetical protein